MVAIYVISSLRVWH